MKTENEILQEIEDLKKELIEISNQYQFTLNELLSKNKAKIKIMVRPNMYIEDEVVKYAFIVYRFNTLKYENRNPYEIIQLRTETDLCVYLDFVNFLIHLSKNEHKMFLNMTYEKYILAQIENHKEEEAI